MVPDTIPDTIPPRLNNEAIDVYGPNGTTTAYSVQNGEYISWDTGKAVAPNTLKGAQFDVVDPNRVN
jgi:hypothetical protein